MSTFTVCGKRIIGDITQAQSIPTADTQAETAYAVLRDSENYLERLIKSDMQDGVNATVAIKRPPFDCSEGVECDGVRLCEASTTAVPYMRWETFEIDDCIQSKAYKITSTDYEEACRGEFTMAFRHSIMNAVREVKRQFNNVSVAFLKANVGNWVDGAPTKQLPIAAATTGAGLYPTWTDIQRQYAAVGINTTPNILGGAPIFAIMKTLPVKNPLLGYSAMEAMEGVSLFYEPAFDFSTPANQIISWNPQSVQVVTYNRYFQDFAQGTRVRSDVDVYSAWKEGRVRSTGVIPINFYTNKDPNGTPVTVWSEFEGLPDNCGDYVFQLKIRYKFVKVLTDLCNENGFNGIFTLTTCPTVLPTCPDDPTPVVPLVYCMDWPDTPCDTPYQVSSITIGGSTYTGVPMNYTNVASLVTIINTFIGGPPTVYLDGSTVKSALPLSSGYLNNNEYPFTFSECPGS